MWTQDTGNILPEATEARYITIDTTHWTRSVYWDGYKAVVLNINNVVWESAGTTAQYTWAHNVDHFQRVWLNATQDTAVNDWYHDRTWNGTDTSDQQGRIYVMEFRYVSPADGQQLEPLTANFAPLPVEDDLNEEFYRHLERLGGDDEYLIEQIRWHDTLEVYLREDANRYQNLREVRLQISQTQLLAVREEALRKKREKNLARWDVEEIPPLTPELLRQINRTSREFLAQWLSPGELELYDKEGHVKVQSGIKPEVYYIVKKGKQKRIIQYIHGKEAISLGYFSDWGDEIPEDDIVAMKVFDLKYNERAVQLKSCKVDLRKGAQRTTTGNGTTYTLVNNTIYAHNNDDNGHNTGVTNPHGDPYDEEIADLIATHE